MTQRWTEWGVAREADEVTWAELVSLRKAIKNYEQRERDRNTSELVSTLQDIRDVLRDISSKMVNT